MKIRDVMAPDVHTIGPDETVQTAAQLMAELDTGTLPVSVEGALQGILTDRDIIIRVVAAGLPPAGTPVRAVMSSDVFTCDEDAPAAEIAEEMRRRQIRRVPVVGDGRIIGIVTLGDIIDAGAAPAGGADRARR
ncbi:MAG TPA: CBS domain-containing protein [Alphaproteobacteria bacterium]|nr:CBS domain-containing protein [Alphaproteobacteria bacterium]